MEEGYFCFTSNVDGQLQKAGFEEKRVVECHGSIHYLQYPDGSIKSAEGVDIEVDGSNFRARDPLPRVDGAILRPNILMFGDWGWYSDRTEEQEVELQDWISGLDRRRTKLVVVEIGAGEQVPTVRRFSERVVGQFKNSRLIRVNPRDYDVPQGGIGISMGALEGLKKIDDILTGEMK